MQLPQGDFQLVQIMDAALAEAAQKAGSVAGLPPPAARNAAMAHLPSVRSTRCAFPPAWNRFAAKIPPWPPKLRGAPRRGLRSTGPIFPGDPTTGLLGDSDVEQERFEEFANEVACPGAGPRPPGRCDVYAWRPMTCRVFGPPVRMGDGEALGCCELCFVGVGEAEIAACEMPLPHELEAKLLDEIPASGETVVAFALLR